MSWCIMHIITRTFGTGFSVIFEAVEIVSFKVVPVLIGNLDIEERR